jgi:hypothetical protein
MLERDPLRERTGITVASVRDYPNNNRGSGSAARFFPSRHKPHPSKSKQKCLGLLGFIRPNRDFSMGYDEKNKNQVSRLLGAGAPRKGVITFLATGLR